ncbi:MAG: ATP synthase F1 subunit delta [Clostridiales bacterium]
MTDKTVAKRYAKALFAIGEEQGKSEIFAKNMKDLKEVIEENNEVRHMLENQSIDNTQKKAAMKAIFADADDSVKNFMSLVIDKNRSYFFVDMCKYFQNLIEESSNTVKAIVKSAVVLSDEQIGKIETKFSALIKQNVKAQAMVDPALIGGVQVMIGDKLYDGTVAHQIKQLSDNLKEQRC